VKRGGHTGRAEDEGMKAYMFRAAFLLLVLTVSLPFAAGAQASEVKVIVNGVPITNYDIQHRAAFLKVQRRAGASAEQDMIDQTLRSVEMQRLKINISDQAVDEAYARFAKNNKLTPSQLDQVLARTGVGKDHFREFIRVQIGWGQAIAARARAESQDSQNLAWRMLEKGGKKPTATEYMLQQVIFVVPPKDRKAILARRKREAEALRARFQGCDKTRQFAKGLIDVTVRDLGRYLAPELPPDWAQPIKDTKPGSATIVRETERGVEFIGICSAREVSDDRAAQLSLQNTGNQEDKAKAMSDKYMAELKKKARIIER
jgi:peptidyl-prolyl cis-trans isomerase SurA